jgi:hypothetical protein
MTGLLGPNGKPISSAQFQNKKADPPKMGSAFGDWAGRDIQFMRLPGGDTIMFDLSKLTLDDFRTMRDHYQVNVSLAVLSFMQHQCEFHYECPDDKRIEALVDEQLHENWTRLNRSMSTANWAGFSPNALEWDNDYNGRQVVLAKVKDLVPEECAVNWETEELWAPPGYVRPKTRKFAGIKQFGMGWPIPVDNSFWYPILMENGNYYGRKLLRAAFQPWFFSLLIHLFANRYYERFGEPTPIGRAPFDEDIQVGDVSRNGAEYMLSILANLRNRGVIVLPNSRTQDVNGKESFDYDIEYLESQMRGADFERYMTRLDEEISLALFTPILLLRTADVGSYNLGQGHMQVYLYMLNALNDDRAFYMKNYIASPLTDFNFSPAAPRGKVKFQKLGTASAEMIKEIVVALIKAKDAKPDLTELGKLAGMSFTEIQQTLVPPPVPADPNQPPGDPNNPPTVDDPAKKAQAELFSLQIKATAHEIKDRVRGQIEAAWREDRFGAGLQVNMGYKVKFSRAAVADGVPNGRASTEALYAFMDAWLEDTLGLGRDEFSSPDSFMGLFSKVLDLKVEELAPRQA